MKMRGSDSVRLRACAASLIAALAALVCAQEEAVQAPVDESPYSSVDLTSAFTTIVAEETFTVGLRFKLDEGWHMYWRNPGESGGPPVIAWTLPDGFEVVRTFWPTPERITVAGLVNYVYEHEATLLVQIRVPEGYVAGTPIPIQADIEYLICKEQCLVAKDSVVGTLPESAVWQNLASLRKRFPNLSPVDGMKFERDGGTVRFEFPLQNVAADRVTSAYFYAAKTDVLDHGANQTWKMKGRTLYLEASVSEYANGDMRKPEGVLVVEYGNRTLAIEFYRPEKQDKRP